MFGADAVASWAEIWVPRHGLRSEVRRRGLRSDLLHTLFNLGWLPVMIFYGSNSIASLDRVGPARQHPPTVVPRDNDKRPVDGHSDPPAFACPPPRVAARVVETETLRKRARVEPIVEGPPAPEPEPRPLTLTVTGWEDSTMCGERFNFNALEWGNKVIFPLDQQHMQTIDNDDLYRQAVVQLYRAVAAISNSHRRSQAQSKEVEDLSAQLFDLSLRYQDQVQANQLSLAAQEEHRRARRTAEERRLEAEQSLLTAIADYQNSNRFRQDALEFIRKASDDFAMISKDWLTTLEGVKYAAEISFEDFYEGSRHMQREIYDALQASNPQFMPADLGLPLPLHSWADHHLNEGSISPAPSSDVAPATSGSGERHEIPLDHA
nr:MAP7 domain-containing protein 1-like [Ipomoea batatas]